MTVAKLTRLNRETLQLVLVAAVAHPDRAVRAQVADKLDAGIEARQPLHTVRHVRQLLVRRSRRRGYRLPPTVRETAVRVLRLVFARDTSVSAQQPVRISAGAETGEQTFFVNRALKTFNLRKEPLTRERRRQQTVPVEFRAGRLAGWLHPPRSSGSVQAVCRLDDGFALELNGWIPWNHAPTLLANSSLGERRGLAGLGFACGIEQPRLWLRTTTPEAVIRFSACLARREVLVLRALPSGAVIFVQLQEFDGEACALRTLMRPGVADWLKGMPTVHLSLSNDELAGLRRWCAGCAAEAVLLHHFRGKEVS